jgi:L-ribulose-5-phosphate 3-epimerase
MRLGIFEGAFPVGLDLANCFALVKQAGFEGVELSLQDTTPLLPEARNETTQGIMAIEQSVGLDQPREGGLRLNSTPEEIEQIGRMARTTGLAVTSVSTMQLFYYPLSSRVPVVRERAIRIVRKMIESTAQLGGDLVLVVPGMVTAEDPYEDVWQRSCEVLSPLVPYAQQMGVSIAIENVWNRFLLSPLEYRDYIDSFASPFVGAYFDVANVLRYGFPEQWIELLGRRLKRIHFKDYRLDVDDIRGFTYLMQGDVPWSRVVNALRKIGYAGWAIVEVSPYRVHPEQALFDSFAALRRLLD